MHSFYSVIQNKSKVTGTVKIKREASLVNINERQSELDNKSDGLEAEDEHNET